MAQCDVEAVRWYRKAADQGDADAQGKLGVTYQQGRGVAQSDVEAVRWWQKAADQGNAGAQAMVGMNLLDGRGVPKDLAKSHKYLSLAAANGLKEAKEILRAAFPNGAPSASASFCAQCGVTPSNLSVCARCKAVSYCSKECQRVHWKAGHKKACCSEDVNQEK